MTDVLLLTRGDIRKAGQLTWTSGSFEPTLLRSRSREAAASFSSPRSTSIRGDSGNNIDPPARMTPGIIWIPRGSLQEMGPGSDRVANPIQKPNTTPSTIESCSNATSAPRVSGEAISPINRGHSMLNAPIPIPPMARPKPSVQALLAFVWRSEPTQKTTPKQ